MDIREKLRRELVQGALGMMDEDALDNYKDRLTVILNKYEITNRETALAICNEDKNRQYMMEFLTAKAAEGCTNRTLNFYRAELPKTLFRIGKTVDEITPDDVRLWIVQRTRRDGVTLTTVGNEFRVLSSFFTWLRKEELINRNPIDKVEHPKKRKVKKKAFSEIDLERIRGACRTNRERAMIELLLSTWCRVTEIVNIRTQEIEGDRVVVLGKGNKERTVFLNAKAQFALEQYMQERKDLNPYIFPRAKRSITMNCKGKKQEMLKLWYSDPEEVDESRHMDQSSFEGVIRNIGIRAGVENTHPHRFRRTGATRALENGMPIMTVSKILGHESVGTTQIYLDISEDNIQIEHRKFVR